MSLLKRIEKVQRPPAQGPGETASQSGATGLKSGNTPSRFQEMLISNQTIAPTQGDPYHDLRRRIQDQLLDALDPRINVSQPDAVRAKIREEFEQILSEGSIILSRAEKKQLFEHIAADILGLGPIQPLLEDETITEVMVNGAGNVYVERNGRLERTEVTFEDDEHVMHVIDRIVSPLGRRIDESSPYVDARLPDGSRVNAIIPPWRSQDPL